MTGRLYRSALSISSSCTSVRGTDEWGGARGGACPRGQVRENGTAPIEVELAPELGQEQRPEPVDTLAAIRLVRGALAQRGDVARLEQAARRDRRRREQVVCHGIEHIAEREVVLQAVEALADC